MPSTWPTKRNLTFSSFKSSFNLFVVVEGSVAVVHLPVVVHSLPIGQRGERQLRARRLGLQVLVDHSLIGRVGRQHSQQVFCGKRGRRNEDFNAF